MKQLFYIKNEDQSENTRDVLLLIVGSTYCSFAVFNHASKELLQFGYYSMDNGENISTLFDLHAELKEPFFQTVVAYDTDEAQLIPSSYYKYQEAKLHLDTVYGICPNRIIVTEDLPDKKMHTLYRVSADAHDLLNKRFISGKFWHLNSIYLNNLQDNPDDAILINFKPAGFSILVFKNGILQLTNTFYYDTPEDVLYYLLKICQQCGLSQQSTKIILSGLIEKDSAIYRELFKYFIDLHFEQLPGHIKITDDFCNYPGHYFTTITKLSQCVS